MSVAGAKRVFVAAGESSSQDKHGNKASCI